VRGNFAEGTGPITVPRPCSVCLHQECATINRELIVGKPNRRIAARHGLTEQALRRHKNRHLPALLAKAQEAEEIMDANDLLGRLRALNREVAEVLREAKQVKDHDLRLKAIARAEKQIELEGRLLGELRDGATVNIAVTPEWLAVRTALLAALLPHPEARIAVAERLLALETGHAG
jgi:hypothetical protein